MAAFSSRIPSFSIRNCLNLGVKRWKQFSKYHIPLLIYSALLTYTIFKNRTVWAIKSFLLDFLLLQSWIPNMDVCLSFNGVAWFLSTSIFLACITPAIKKICERTNKSQKICLMFGLIIIAIILACIITDNACYWLYIFPPTRILDYFTGFIVGKLYMDTQKADYCEKKDRWYNMALFVMIIIYCALLSYNIGLAESIRCQAIYLPFALITTYLLALQSNSKIYRRIFGNKIIVYLGNNGLYYMLTHQLVLRTVYKACQIVNLNIQGNILGSILCVFCLLVTIGSKPVFDVVIKKVEYSV